MADGEDVEKAADGEESGCQIGGRGNAEGLKRVSDGRQK